MPMTTAPIVTRSVGQLTDFTFELNAKSIAGNFF